MTKEIRSTIYLEEDLYNKFREACNKKFGDKQGKIKRGYIFAITNFVNHVSEEVVDIVIEMKPQPENSAKKLDEAEIKTQPEPEPEPEIPEPEPEISAKKLDEAEIKTPQQVIEESKIEIKTPQQVIEETKIPQEPMELPTTVADNPPVSATKLDEAETVSVDEGLKGLIKSLQNKEAEASVELDQDTELHTTTEPLLKTPEQLEEERLAKVKDDQRISKIETQSNFVSENSPEAKAKRNLERERAVKNQ